MLSQGIPMMLGGDELGRTQAGNNNAYCQDNEISWFDWAKIDQGLLTFARRIMNFRNEHPVFRRRRWFQGRPGEEGAIGDIAWFRPDGQEMAEENWLDGDAKALAVFLNGDALHEVTDTGRPIRDDSFLLLFNAHGERQQFTLPPAAYGSRWQVMIDTTDRNADPAAIVSAGDSIDVGDRSLIVLSRHESA
jgi:glycogen operon protein